MESTTSEITFAKKPSLIPALRRNNEVNLVSNYLKTTINTNHCTIKQYSLKFEPEVASDNEGLRRQIFRGVSKRLRELFHPYSCSGDSLFSAQTVDEKVTITYTRDESDGQYLLTIEKTGNEIDLSNIKVIDNFTSKVKMFMEIVFRNILNANQGMIRFNRKNIFDYKAATQLKDTGNIFK